jgi:hypothetical protein
MKVEVTIDEDELEGDHGWVRGLRVTCERCGHSVEVFGTTDASARRGAAMLREECPEGEENYYDVAWYG